MKSALLIPLGLIAGLVLGEGALRLAGLPEFHEAHSSPPQFVIYRNDQTGEFFYTNTPSAPIEFVYDSNPRGYFEPGNAVRHATNSAGFRGAEFGEGKPPGTIRLAFIGDSFTFGEGVHFEDTFPEATARLLQKEFADRSIGFESLNFGVGGYNAVQSLSLLKHLALSFRPDAVVLTYVLNDAEPMLLGFDPVRMQPVRRQRTSKIAEGTSDDLPPDSAFYRLRIARLVWQARKVRERSRQTEAFYRALYEPGEEGWRNARRALHEMAKVCEGEQIPLVVMIFPILHDLDNGHPFLDLYAEVAASAEAGGAQVLDLFPGFRGRPARSLWVHPTDQHPNERAHRIAAEQLAAFLGKNGGFLERVEYAVARR
jgi:lysophospholipase L1-like esterase